MKRAISLKLHLLAFILLGLRICTPASAQTTTPPTPPTPTPDPVLANVFYGAVNPLTANFKTPVLVFVPGLGGVASDWWTNNDMYAYAYQEGYRTAFISPNSNNTPATSNIASDAAVLQTAIPRVASYYNVKQMYFIGHSKGGVDLQSAILNTTIGAYVKALFTVASPNQGTALADWAYANPSISGPLNLLTPAVFDLEVENMATFRSGADPVFMSSLAKPFYYFSADNYFNSSTTFATGSILKGLVPGTDENSQNDGLVTVGESALSPEYSNQLGIVPVDHFQMNLGDNSFFKIRGRIQALELGTSEFQRIAVNGLSRFGGSAHSTWIWSMRWFNNKLYIGTGQEEYCLTLLTSDVRTGTKTYPAAVKGDQCPDEVTLAESMAADIWEFTPSTNTWRLAYQSPVNVPVTVNGQNIMTAIDSGYRGMEVFTEPSGTQALYVGAVTSGSAFQASPFQPNGWPAPRILRTTDGVNWAPLPQDPGTFLGNIGNYYLNPTSLVRGFRSLTSFNGSLYITAGTYEGSGIIIASSNPAAGDNAFQQVSPDWDVLPVWDTKVFNNYLYAATGFTRQENATETGYGLYKTAGTGTPPYTFTPIVINGGWQSNPVYLAPNGLSLNVFRNELYMGTNRPTELIKVRPDDTWDVVVGQPRTLPAGANGCPAGGCVKAPLSGIGNGMGNWMTGHFWRMASITGQANPDQVSTTGQNMFLGTWDWSVLIQQISALIDLDKLWTHQYGTDVYRSEDGIHFTEITQGGFGDANNSGTRSLEPTPVGLFLGTARQRFGAEVLARKRGSTTPLLAPRRLRAQSGTLGAGAPVNLAWDPSPGAATFNVYRATALPLTQIFPSSITFPLPNGQTLTVTMQELASGQLNSLCSSSIISNLSSQYVSLATELCAALPALAADATSLANSPAAFPLSYELIASTTSTSYSENAPSSLQSLYFVRAVDTNGNLSDPSNIVGAPSLATAVPALACDINGDGFVDSNDVAEITESFATPVFGSSDPRDANHDGVINVLDARFCSSKCTSAGCALQ